VAKTSEGGGTDNEVESTCDVLGKALSARKKRPNLTRPIVGVRVSLTRERKKKKRETCRKGGILD